MEPISISFKTRFGSDLLWNVGSLAVLGVSGIVANILIARLGSGADLGVFNQVFAFFLFLSQLSVGGVHFAVLKELSDPRHSPEVQSHLVLSALLTALVLASMVVVCCFPLVPVVGGYVNSVAVERGLAAALPGLVFFSLNKVLLNSLNGLRHMRAYAIFQAARYLILLSSISFVLIFNIDRIWLCGALSCTEVLLFLMLAPYVHLKTVVLRVSLSLYACELRAWAGRQLRFGARGMLSGVFTELNTRVDVLVLGFLLDDGTVGVYSFAAVFAEGFAQLSLVLRRNLDPIIGGYLARGMRVEVSSLIARTRRMFLPIMCVIAVLLCVGYSVGLPFVVPDPSYQDSTVVLGILSFAVAVTAWSRPFGGLLLQSGRPGLNTAVTGVCLVVNVGLAFLLTPSFGLAGCAMATASTYFVEGLLIVALGRTCVQVRL